MKIAIFSSWLPKVSEENQILAKENASYLAEQGVTVVTGGCSGIPAVCIEEAYRLGAKTVGYFPHKDKKDYTDRQHEENTHDIRYYAEAHFIQGFTARSLEMIKNVDAAIVLNGRIGTLSEFGIAVEEGLPLAVIEGTGGITDELQRLTKLVNKEFPNNEVVFEKDWKVAIDGLIAKYSKNKRTF
jgi:uncharacterized protein (TIGR00725 family)